MKSKIYKKMKTTKHNVFINTCEKINIFKIKGKEQKSCSLPKHNVLQSSPLQAVLWLYYIINNMYKKINLLKFFYLQKYFLGGTKII